MTKKNSAPVSPVINTVKKAAHVSKPFAIVACSITVGGFSGLFFFDRFLKKQPDKKCVDESCRSKMALLNK